MPQIRNLTIAGLALCVAALGGVAWQQQREIARLRGQTLRDRGTLTPSIVQRSAAGRHLALPLSRTVESSGDDYRPEMLATDFGFARGKSGVTAAGSRKRTLATLVENPEFITALGTYQQGILDVRFAGLFRKLNLNEGELADFKRLLAQKENAEFDVVAVGDSVSESPLSSEELRATVRTVQTQVENEIRTSLGADRYAQYRDFANTLPQRATVAQLQQRLSYSNAPLTEAQSESMVKILAQHAPASDAVLASPSVVVASGDMNDRLPIISSSAVTAIVSDEALASAQTVLSTQQIGALAQLQTEQHSTMRATQMLRAAFPYSQPPPEWKILFQ